MFAKLFGNKSFKDIYPSLDSYIKNKDNRDKLINNQDYIDLYKKNKTLIDTFVYELNKYYKKIEIEDIFMKYVTKLDSHDFVYLITLYLNLSNKEKANKLFFSYYDDVFDVNLKTEEEYSKEHQIDATYNSLKKGNEKFHNVSLDSLYKELAYPERRYINSLLSHNNGWEVFHNLFVDRYYANFNNLIKLLNRNLIDGVIINQDTLDQLGHDMFTELVFVLLSNNNREIAKHIQTLIKNRRYDLIIDMINENLIGDTVFINTITSENLNEQDLIDKLELFRVKKQVNN